MPKKKEANTNKELIEDFMVKPKSLKSFKLSLQNTRHSYYDMVYVGGTTKNVIEYLSSKEIGDKRKVRVTDLIRENKKVRIIRTNHLKRLKRRETELIKAVKSWAREDSNKYEVSGFRAKSQGYVYAVFTQQ